MNAKRAVIYEVGAEVVHAEPLEAGQYLLKLKAPDIADAATPGSFVHLGVIRDRLSLRRPFSVLWSDPSAGTIELLYKVVGEGTDQMTELKGGEIIPTLGPIGQGFEFDEDYDFPVLIGGGVGIPPILFLARELRERAQAFVVMGSEIPFPFKSQPSQIRVPGVPQEVIAGMSLLEDWGVASRLCSKQGYRGCHDGYVDDLARRYLNAQPDERRRRIAVYACGPMPMLKAVARLAQDFDLPCQVCVEEYMACAVGGCAGCTIPVMGKEGAIAMKRVCVDGPVFDARGVFYSDA